MRSHYEKVIAAIPSWKPTYRIPHFGVNAIKHICGCDTAQAVEILDRLTYEGAVPKEKW
ncbi:hypothetical protein BN1080_02098 [Planococcus massiliensis]|uniref:Uncharacterized protein n=1 Tax=Planococcus massiliensis TaxID=1499687 RepID=A0A098ELG0_9BACL|nr:hypothetical protein [Planococcus massiliensis]CEG23154.1 hypothetical protein BN1080_02098 [Planococcus massiliensis]